MKFYNDIDNKTNYYETAFFGWQDKSLSLIGINEGYKNAADRLVDYVLTSKSIKDRDQFIFPILFNYRQSIEALLKLIYFRANGKICKGGHDLLRIWKNIENDVIKILFKDKEIQVKEIENALKEFQGANRSNAERKEFDQCDEKADVWRYLISSSEKLYFNEGHWIYYPKLKEDMNELYATLECIYSSVDNRLS